MSTERKGSSEYARKLLDGRWQRKRLEILQRDNFCCTICQRSHNVQIHHNWYLKNMEPWDYTADQLVSLCNEHHEEIGELQEGLKRLLARSGPAIQRQVYDYLFGLLNQKREVATPVVPVSTGKLPKLSAYRQNESARIPRLERVCERLRGYHWFEIIDELHDCKGCLTCKWKRVHNDASAFLKVYEAWEAEGEPWECVEHIGPTGHHIRVAPLPCIVWKFASDRLPGMLADFANQAIDVKKSGSKWSVQFPAGGTKTVEFCNAPERKSQILGSLKTLGYEAEVEFYV